MIRELFISGLFEVISTNLWHVGVDTIRVYLYCECNNQFIQSIGIHLLFYGLMSPSTNIQVGVIRSAYCLDLTVSLSLIPVQFDKESNANHSGASVEGRIYGTMTFIFDILIVFKLSICNTYEIEHKLGTILIIILILT